MSVNVTLTLVAVVLEIFKCPNNFFIWSSFMLNKHHFLFELRYAQDFVRIANSSDHMRHFAQFGTICTILKT